MKMSPTRGPSVEPMMRDIPSTYTFFHLSVKR